MTALESQRFGQGYFAGLPTAEEIADARTKLLALQKTQEEVIKRQQDALAAETEQPLVVPGARQADALRKIQDDLQKQLRDIDLTAGFVTPLELAEQRLKAIEESFKRMREVVPQIGEGLRQTLVPTGKTTPFDQMIEASAARYRQDPNVIRALIEQESGFNPQARSPAGAQGLMQIMPGTATQYGGAGKNLLDAATNIDLGTKIFADLMQRFGNDMNKALTAYNAGPGRGGIPLPTGENATFAADVRRRIPRGPGDVLAQTEAQRRVAELAVEAETPNLSAAAKSLRPDENFCVPKRNKNDKPMRQPANDANRHSRQGRSISGVSMQRSPHKSSRWRRSSALRRPTVRSKPPAIVIRRVSSKRPWPIPCMRKRLTKAATAIREVALIEAQLPELRPQAAESAPAGELAIKRVQDEADALRTLEENLAESRMPRHTGGFPFGRTREEIAASSNGLSEIFAHPEASSRPSNSRSSAMSKSNSTLPSGLVGSLPDRRPVLVAITHGGD